MGQSVERLQYLVVLKPLISFHSMGSFETKLNLHIVSFPNASIIAFDYSVQDLD